MIDIGDCVFHKPSGEKWIVAAVRNEELYWCGYPFGGCGKLKDCELLEKATPEDRKKLIQEIARMKTNESPVGICQRIAAREGITLNAEV